jgi:hypothetical protein
MGFLQRGGQKHLSEEIILPVSPFGKLRGRREAGPGQSDLSMAKNRLQDRKPVFERSGMGKTRDKTLGTSVPAAVWRLQLGIRRLPIGESRVQIANLNPRIGKSNVPIGRWNVRSERLKSPAGHRRHDPGRVRSIVVDVAVTAIPGPFEKVHSGSDPKQAHGPVRQVQGPEGNDSSDWALYLENGVPGMDIYVSNFSCRLCSIFMCYWIWCKKLKIYLDILHANL